MWINQTGATVRDNESYTAPDGTQYPVGFPKAEIPGLTWVADPAPTPPTPEQIQQDVIYRTQMRLDSFALTQGYDGILSACTYATDPLPRFAADGQYAMLARGSTWATLYALLAEVQAGQRTMPTDFAEVEPLLPELVWPA